MGDLSKNLVTRIQNIVFQILCDIDDYCKNNNLTYYLSGGSCLGAVRHHGFIPWDDDADIMMPRNDYEKLLEGFGNVYKGKYQVGSLNTNNQWCRTYTRIWDSNTELIQTKAQDIKMGIFIDVFPIDGLPDNRIGQKIFFAKIKSWNVLRNAAIRTDFYDYEKFRRLKKILSFVAKPFGARYFAVKIEKEAKKYPFESSRYVAASLAVHYGQKEIIEREHMEKGICIPFESGAFPVPIGYKQYLTNLYGDYMKIPKDAEEKGYSHLDGWMISFPDQLHAEVSLKQANDISGKSDRGGYAYRYTLTSSAEKRCA